MKITPPISRKKIDQNRLVSVRVFNMIAKFGQWCKDHEVAAGYIVNTGTYLVLFVVSNDEIYDFELSSKLCEFSGSFIARQLISNATMIPKPIDGELENYFKVDEAIKVW